jgi:hypothetical protein
MRASPADGADGRKLRRLSAPIPTERFNACIQNAQSDSLSRWDMAKISSKCHIKLKAEAPGRRNAGSENSPAKLIYCPG